MRLLHNLGDDCLTRDNPTLTLTLALTLTLTPSLTPSLTLTLTLAPTLTLTLTRCGVTAKNLFIEGEDGGFNQTMTAR